MAVTFVNNALGATNSTTSFSITLPATQAGDIILLEYTHRGTNVATIGGTYSGGAFDAGSGINFNGGTFSTKRHWSRATGNHSGQTVTGASLVNSCAAIVTVYRGALSSGDPVSAGTGEANASGNETQAQLTSVPAAAYVVLLVGNSPDLAVTSPACTSPGALQIRAERLSTGGTDSSIMHASEEFVAGGSTGSFTWAQSDAASGSFAYHIIPEPVGGQIFTETHDDTLVVAESQPKSALRGRVSSDVMAVAEATDKKIVRGRAVADTLDLTEAQVKIVVRGRVAPDTIGVTDLQRQHTLRGPVQLETLTVGDLQPRTVFYARRVDDAAVVTDQAIGVTVKSRAVSDLLALTEQQVKEITRGRAVPDVVDVTDQSLQHTLRDRAQADQLSLTDTQPKSVLRGRVQTDTMQTTDVIRSFTLRGRVQADLLAVADVALRLSVLRARLASDAVLVTDQAQQWTLRNRLIADAAGLFDQAIGEVFEWEPPAGTIYDRAVFDGVGVIDELMASALRGRSHADAVAITDAALRGVYRNRLFGESLSVQDFALASLLRTAMVADSVTVLDHQLRFTLSSRAILDLLEVSELVSRTHLPAVLFDVRIRLGDAGPAVRISGRSVVSVGHEEVSHVGHDHITLGLDDSPITLGGY